MKIGAIAGQVLGQRINGFCDGVAPLIPNCVLSCGTSAEQRKLTSIAHYFEQTPLVVRVEVRAERPADHEERPLD